MSASRKAGPAAFALKIKPHPKNASQTQTRKGLRVYVCVIERSCGCFHEQVTL